MGTTEIKNQRKAGNQTELGTAAGQIMKRIHHGAKEVMQRLQGWTRAQTRLRWAVGRQECPSWLRPNLAPKRAQWAVPLALVGSWLASHWEAYQKPAGRLRAPALWNAAEDGAEAQDA